MTRDDESNPFQTVLQLLADEGFDGFATALEILLNEAMKLERAAVLQAEPYQRTPQRRGHANGFKPKTVLCRLGKLQLAIPQTRGIEFYPSVLERGERSERALKLALAEMYVQGVSTRKVAAITQELCGTEVTELHPAERNCGYVPQALALFPTMTVREHLAFAMQIRRASPALIEERVAELSQLLGIESLLWSLQQRSKTL